jgi:phage shock protein C
MINPTRTRRLYRSTEHVMIAGVAGGIADYVQMDPTLVRVVMFLTLLLTTGPFGLLVYAALAWIMPFPDSGV